MCGQNNNNNNNNPTYDKDIIHSAALAFHKALIGVTQLRELESSKLRLPTAVITYYIVYHVFTLCMLSESSVKTKAIAPCDLKDLNSISELPQQWNLQRDLEADYATQIKHADIKKYCEKVRKKQPHELSSTEQILFDNFIKQPPDDTTPCISGMYEKLCYVRDRAIYRPSAVRLTNGGYAQTSAEVKKEIDSLPSSKELYKIITDIYKNFLSRAQSERSYYCLLTYMWCFPVDCSSDLNGLSREETEALKALEFLGTENCFCSHICHMLELYDDISKIKEYDTLYWKPLYDTFFEMRAKKAFSKAAPQS